MEIYILDQQTQARIYPEAYEMLAAADREFIPPLSSRVSSTQKDLSAAAAGENISRYFEQLKQQRFAAAFEGDTLIAFVSYIENYCCDVIPPEKCPNIYLSTLVVSPKARGKGVTKALYGRLFAEYKAFNIFTRTWSTNLAHIKILQGYGFETIKVLKNDRGNGIDTVYFELPANTERQV